MRFIRKGGRVIPIREKKNDVPGSGKVVAGAAIHAGVSVAQKALGVLHQGALQAAVKQANVARSFKVTGDLAKFGEAKRLAHGAMRTALAAKSLGSAAKGLKMGAATLGIYGFGQMVASLSRKQRKDK